MLVRVGAAADLPAAFVAAAVVVFPAVNADGVTRTSVEAAAMGALTVISDVGPAREIVAAPPYEGADARTGWLVRTERRGRACDSDRSRAWARRFGARSRPPPVAGKDSGSVLAPSYDA